MKIPRHLRSACKMRSSPLRKLAKVQLRFEDDAIRMRTQAAELVRLDPDVIFCVSGTAALALQQQAKPIPIIFAAVGGLTGRDSLVKNIARPEGNLTGFTNTFGSMGSKLLELLKEAAPRLARVGIFSNPDTTLAGGVSPSMETAAQVLGVKVLAIPFHDPAELERAIDTFAMEPNGGWIVSPPYPTLAQRQLMIQLAARYRLPLMSPFLSYPAEGGLMAYGSDFADQFRGAASYVDRVLRGAKVSELPVQFPTKFKLVINLATAKALGLDIPWNLQVFADEVIE